MNKGKLFAQLPSVDEILKHDCIKNLIIECSRSLVVENIRENIDNLRDIIVKLDKDSLNDFKIDEDDLIKCIIKSSKENYSSSLKKVINGTGVVLHTNLGRSLVSEKIINEAMQIASRYSNLEYDLNSGNRGSRYDHVESVIKKITGAESVLVVNNNAAAVLLVLNTLAQKKEVIVSRGELVEIGGSFRIPSVMKMSGCILAEVGTTNKTHLKDYEEMINENTAAILKVHTSNYKILGFTKSVDVDELSDLSKKYNVPMVEDIGSGLFIDVSKYGLSYEPTVMDSLKKGVDIITFSGDKMLGGPQAGIIIGKKEYIDKMKNNQLTRALRVDKITLAILEATFKLYLDQTKAIDNIPILKMLTCTMETIISKSNQLVNKILSKNLDIQIRIEDGFSKVGGGSMPLEQLITKNIIITPNKISAGQLEKKLRFSNGHIIARVNNDTYILDARTIFEDEFDVIANELQSALM